MARSCYKSGFGSRRGEKRPFLHLTRHYVLSSTFEEDFEKFRIKHWLRAFDCRLGCVTTAISSGVIGWDLPLPPPTPGSRGGGIPEQLPG